MSVNVNFADVPTTRASRPNDAARIILPYDVLVNLQGRRVTVFLSVRGEELEGTLRTVDSDRGDVFLEQVVHYSWSAASGGDKGTSGEASGTMMPQDGAAIDDKTATCLPCRGGGLRRELRRCAAATVNHRYIALITPALSDT